MTIASALALVHRAQADPHAFATAFVEQVSARGLDGSADPSLVVTAAHRWLRTGRLDP